MKFGVLPQPVGLLKLLLNLFCTSNIGERTICLDFIKYAFDLCWDTCEPICFKTWTDAG